MIGASVLLVALAVPMTKALSDSSDPKTATRDDPDDPALHNPFLLDHFLDPADVEQQDNDHASTTGGSRRPRTSGTGLA